MSSAPYMVGKDTWLQSIDCVRKLGTVVSFGAASGFPEPYDFAREGLKKSPFITRTTAVNYQTTDEIRTKSARSLFRMMRSGAVKIRIGQTYPLKDAARAHRDAEARRTTGSTLLIP